MSDMLSSLDMKGLTKISLSIFFVCLKTYFLEMFIYFSIPKRDCCFCFLFKINNLTWVAERTGPRELVGDELPKGHTVAPENILTFGLLGADY